MVTNEKNKKENEKNKKERRQEFQEIGNKMKDSQCVFIMLKQDFTWKPHTLVRLGQYS